MSYSRGSVWRKWDLHVHTPDTKLADDFKSGDKDKWLLYCEYLYKSDVFAFGITDYFSVDNYINFTKKYKELYPHSDKVFFPNVEFRIDSKNKDNEHIQVHIIFSNKETVLSKIQDFFTRLALVSTDDINLTSKYCNSNDLLIVGYKKAMVKIDVLTSQLKSDFSESEYLIVGLARGYGSLRPGKNDSRGGEYAKELDKTFNLFFGASFDVDFYNNKKAGRSQYNLKKKAVVTGCDAHSFEDLSNKLGKEYLLKNDKDETIDYSEVLWIKADPTFEGLRQILYEPDLRVKIQAQVPDFKEEKLVIDEVKFISKKNLFNPLPIKLNKNLNVIIGGKSSGKSILLYFIASTLETNEEVTKIANDKYQFSKVDSSFNFELKSTSGISKMLNNDNSNSIIPNVKYIPQNYLSKLAEPEVNKKSGELLKYVRGLLLEDDEYKRFYDDFVSIIQSNDKKRDDSITSYFSIKEKIQNTNIELKEGGSEDVLRKSIESNSLRIRELKSGLGLSEEDINLYNSKKSELEKLEQYEIKIGNDFRKIVSHNREALTSLLELQSKKDLVKKSMEDDNLREDFSKTFNSLDEQIKLLEIFIDSHQIIDRKFVNNNKFKHLYDTIWKSKGLLEQELEPFIKNVKVKKEISELELIVAQDSQKLQSIKLLKKEIENYNEALFKSKDELFEFYKDNYSEYIKIIDTLSERTKLPEEKNLTIVGAPKFNVHKFKIAVVLMSDGRSFPEKNYSLFQQEENLIDFDFEKHLSELKTIFNEIVDGKYILNSSTLKKTAIKILLDDYFLDYWSTEYDGDQMSEMSTGKASFVILMLIIGLSKSKAPILIDQPEDNLDNRSITKDLVEYLRNKKLERQIILVTHNPNVVVNADAENIIVAHQKGQNDKETSSPYRFDYINGAIENTKKLDLSQSDLLKSMGIKEHITEIVEGGEEAFKKREQKYGF